MGDVSDIVWGKDQGLGKMTQLFFLVDEVLLNLPDNLPVSVRG